MFSTPFQVAAERGYPATFLGFTPADRAYWREPGLPPITCLPSESADGPSAEFIFNGDDMAPRFPDGTVVGLEPVAARQNLVVGRVYVHFAPPGGGELPVGRLAHVGPTTLELMQDNHPGRLVWPLGADAQTETQDLYEVTCYSLYLPHNEARLPAMSLTDAQPVVLEVTTDAMAPAYPQGTRYFIEPVPSSEWAQATGVHALALDNGTWAVRRLVAPAATPHTLVLESNRTQDVVLLATREVVSVWRLGAAVDLPLTNQADERAAPVASSAQVTTTADEPYLLELHTNDMGPRYPAGARYLARQVPSERWAQATGVHAVQLREGRELLARLVGLQRDRLVLAFDGTDQLSTVALAEVDRLWKLGAADYLPEETMAEHLAFVQRPAY